MPMAHPKSRRRKAVHRTAVSSQTTLGVSGSGDTSGNRVAEAAEKIADGIRVRASMIPSTKIPSSVHVGQGTATTATVYADAPNAYPIETGSRHPLWATGPRGSWHWAREPMKRVRFMEEGAALRLDDAAAAYGKTVDDWLKEIGW